MNVVLIINCQVLFWGREGVLRLPGTHRLQESAHIHGRYVRIYLHTLRFDFVFCILCFVFCILYFEKIWGIPILLDFVAFFFAFAFAQNESILSILRAFSDLNNYIIVYFFIFLFFIHHLFFFIFFYFTFFKNLFFRF